MLAVVQYSHFANCNFNYVLLSRFSSAIKYLICCRFLPLLFKLECCICGLFVSDIFAMCLQLGVDGMKAGQMTHTMKWVMRAMPFVIFPFILNFPSVSCVFDNLCIVLLTIVRQVASGRVCCNSLVLIF